MCVTKLNLVNSIWNNQVPGEARDKIVIKLQFIFQKVSHFRKWVEISTETKKEFKFEDCKWASQLKSRSLCIWLSWHLRPAWTPLIKPCFSNRMICMLQQILFLAFCVLVGNNLFLQSSCDTNRAFEPILEHPEWPAHNSLKGLTGYEFGFVCPN